MDGWTDGCYWTATGWNDMELVGLGGMKRIGLDEIQHRTGRYEQQAGCKTINHLFYLHLILIIQQHISSIKYLWMHACSASINICSIYFLIIITYLLIALSI
ncbi:hypothetical protein ACMFMG_006760 [Clarireedia jacksonii]